MSTRGHICLMPDTDKIAPAPDAATPAQDPAPKQDMDSPREIGGPKGPEPTRYGDWEQNGRCTDF
jgi:hypothetical protein